MGRVTGLGGVFFKASDPKKLQSWYETHLGLKGEGGPVMFRWREKDADKPGTTVWSIFSKDTKYFGNGKSSCMLNYRVDDMDAILARLAQEGIATEGRDDSEYGRFAWITDPEGNRIELWQPPEGQ